MALQLLTSKLNKLGSYPFLRVIHQRASCHLHVKHARRLHCLHRTDRGLVQVRGAEADNFLQGLITNDMAHLQEGAMSMYAMVLNSSGRILHDVIIYNNRTDDSSDVKDFLIEVDSNAIEKLERHLKMYRLRKKIDINVVEQKKCWIVYEPNLDFQTISKVDLECLYINRKVFTKPSIELKTNSTEAIVVRDPRMPYLGHKLLLPSGHHPRDLLDVSESNLETYTDLRYKLGVAEGPCELVPGEVMPLEANVDYLHGISFHKGCYIGQELTARIFHTGVVRKRYMPIVLSTELSEAIPKETNILSSKGKKVGRIRAHAGVHGVALLKIAECLADKGGISIAGMPASTFRPAWWPIEAPKQP